LVDKTRFALAFGHLQNSRLCLWGLGLWSLFKFEELVMIRAWRLIVNDSCTFMTDLTPPESFREILTFPFATLIETG